MIEIGLGVLFFTGIVMALVVLILITRSWLLPSGEVVIRINEDAEKSLFKTGKWKTQPDFLAHAVAALEASGQMVTITPVTE